MQQGPMTVSGRQKLAQNNILFENQLLLQTDTFTNMEQQGSERSSNRNRYQLAKGRLIGFIIYNENQFILCSFGTL